MSSASSSSNATPAVRRSPRTRSAAAATTTGDAPEAARKRASSGAGKSRGPRAPKRQRLTDAELAAIQPIPETLRPNLDILFIGINPGIMSGQKQMHFGNPQNFFWKGLYQSGLIPEAIPPEDGWMLWSKWNMSIANMVQRTTPSTSDLTRREMREAVPELCRKISENPPRIVCFVGKGIYEVFSASSRFELGLQPEVYELDCTRCAGASGEARLPPLRLLAPDETQVAAAAAAEAREQTPPFAYLFVMPSTSGRTTTYQNPEKLQYFRQLRYVRDCVLAGGGIDHDELARIGPQTRSKYFAGQTGG
ncbi:DNA glycosylase [Martensiomyces pterosporus]|nr:DNA glycosylase [Martensiomyces pterosporus]